MASVSIPYIGKGKLHYTIFLGGINHESGKVSIPYIGKGKNKNLYSYKYHTTSSGKIQVGNEKIFKKATLMFCGQHKKRRETPLFVQ